MTPKTKRILLITVRGSAWVVLLSAVIPQLSETPLDNAVAIRYFVIAGLLYAISWVLEKKYEW